MSQLLRPDLNQIRLDMDSLLGRAVALGQHYGKLPTRFLDALMAYLRIRGMEFARRRREGIRLDKEGLEKGIRQCMVCLDLGLEEKAAGDVNAAVEILAGGDFEALRKSGWEKAFGRLEEMRQQSVWLHQRREAAFLDQGRPRAMAWSRITPETWTGVDAEGNEVEVDPQQDYAAFKEAEGRMKFLRSLPKEPVRRLLETEPEGWTFAALLRRLILAVGLGREELEVDDEVARRFREECFVDGCLAPQVLQAVRQQIGEHLERVLESARIRALIAAEIEEEIGRFEVASASGLAELLLLPEAWDELKAARTMAADDLGEWS